MKKSTPRIFAAAAVAAASLALANTAAAVDLRSWDMKINDVTKRFIVLPAFNNQAVLDKETQLVWQRAVVSGKTWYAARHECFASYMGGRLGWRLPSFSELTSLVGTGGVLPAGHPFQNVTGETNIWSTTGYLDTINPGYMYLKPLLSAPVSIKGMGSVNSYVCVRSAGIAERISI